MKKRYLFVAFMLLCVCTSGLANEETEVKNVLKDIPYNQEFMGKRKLVNEDYLLMMQAALKPGQSVPQHDADSNVHLLVLSGEVVIDLAGKTMKAVKGDLVPVASKTPMNIKNLSEADATFLIIKTPHPAKAGK